MSKTKKTTSVAKTVPGASRAKKKKAVVTALHATQGVTIIRIINPFDPKNQKREVHEWRAEKTLLDYFQESPSDLVVSVNGKIIDKGSFGITLLSPDDHVVMCPVIAQGGGGDDKQVLRIVALIAVAVVAPQLGALLGSTAIGTGGAVLGIGAAGWTAAITIGGSLLVNALLPTPQPSMGLSSSSNALAESTSYGIDGAKNTSVENLPVPVVYGTFRVAGNIINLSVENTGDTQILYMRTAVSEGPISDISDVEINNQPIENYLTSGTSTPNIEIDRRLGFNSAYEGQTLMTWFADTVTPYPLNVKLSDSAYTTFTTPFAVNRVRIDVTAPALYTVDTANGNYSAVTVPLQIEYKRSIDTEWTSLAPTAGTSGGRQASGVATIAATALWDPVAKTALQDIGGGENSLYAPMTLTYIWSWGEANAFGPDARFADNIVGELITDPDTIAYLNSNWTYESDAVVDEFRNIYVTSVAPIRQNSNMELSDNKRSAVRRSFSTFDFPTAAVLNIRVKRLTAESALTNVVDKVYVTDINAITTADVTYQSTAMLGLKITLGEQINGIPNVTMLVKGRKIRVNRLGSATEPNGRVWFEQHSDNPAWIVWDILTNSRYGGNISESRLDLAAFQLFADHCTANNLTWNGVFDGTMNVWDACQVILRVGRGQLVGVGTRFTVVVEGITQPSMMFSVANMVEGSFQETWLPMSDRANEIEVTYFDKLDSYKSRNLKVYDTNALAAGRPMRSSAMTLYGVTDYEQAYREAMLQLNMNRYIQQSVTFSAPMEALGCTVGDVIYVQHDMPQWGFAGRTESGSTATTIKLDRPVTMTAGKNYKILIIQDAVQRASGTVSAVIGSSLTLTGYAGAANVKRITLGDIDREVTGVFAGGINLDDTTGIAPGALYTLWDTDVMEERDVVNPNSTVTEVVATAAFAAAPVQFIHWMFGEINKVKKPFRVRSISGSSEYTREISAVEYNESIYSLDGAIPTQNYSSLSDTVDQVIVEGVVESPILIGNIFQFDVTVYFRSIGTLYARSTVWASVNEGPYVQLEDQAFDRATYPNANRGDFIRFKIVARSISNTSATELSAPLTSYTVIAGLPAIRNYDNFTVSEAPDKTRIFNFSYVTPDQIPVRLAGALIRYGVGSGPFTWEAMTPLHDGIQTGSYETTALTAGTYIFAIKAVDTLGQASSSALFTEATVLSDFVGAQLVVLEYSGQTFVFPDKYTSTTTAPTITVTAKLQNASGTCVFVATAFNQAGASLGVITMGGTGNSNRTITADQFTNLGAWPTAYVRVTATLGVISDTVTLYRLNDGVDGSDGDSASSLQLSSSASAFAFLNAAATTTTSPAIVFTAALQNTSGTVTFAAQAFDITGTALGAITLAGSGLTRTLSSAAFLTYPAVKSVSVTATLGGLTDKTTIYRLDSGTNAVTMLLTNEAALVPADSAGVVSSFTGSETNVKVFLGTAEDTANWSFTKADSGLTSAISGNGTASVTLTPSALSGDSGTSTITGTKPGASDVSKVYSLAKVKPGTNAQLLWIESTGQAFPFVDSLATTSTGTSLTFVAGLQGVTGTPTFVANAYNAAGTLLGSITLGGSGLTRTLTAAQFTNSGAWATSYVKIVATLGALTDSVSVYRTSGGSNGVTAILTNEAALVASDSSGTVASFAGSATTIKVFVGSVDDTANWSIARVDDAGLTTALSGVGTATPTLTPSALSTDNANSTLTLTRAGYPTVTKVYSLAKSKAGISAGLLFLTATSDAFAFDNAQATTSASPSIVYTAALQNVTGTVVFSAQAFNGVGAALGAVSLAGTGNSRTLSSVAFLTYAATRYVVVTATLGTISDSYAVYRLDSGTSAVTVILTNEATLVPANNAGVVSSFSGAATNIKVFEGTTDDTPNWGISKVDSGVSTTLSGVGTTVPTLTPTALSGDTGNTTLTISKGTVSVTKIYTIAKSKTGADGVTIVLSNEAALVPANSAGTVLSFAGAATGIKIYVGGVDDTVNWGITRADDGSVTTTLSGVGTGSPTLTPTALTGDTGNSTLTITKSGLTFTKVYTIAKSKSGATGAAGPTGPTGTPGTNGAPGAPGANGATGASGIQSAKPIVYQWAASIPAGPAGTSTYTWSTGSFDSIPSGWSATPGASPSVGFTLWAAEVTLTETAGVGATGFNWTFASISARGYAGVNGTTGAAGIAGASYRTAYMVSTVVSANTTPTSWTEAGSTTTPPIYWGLNSGTWSAWTTTVPALAAGQYLYQTDGIYNPATNQTTWSIPYWSSLKVGSLSAITANLGQVTAGSIDGVTITGGTIRTSATTARVEMTGSSLSSYNSSGQIAASIGTTSSGTSGYMRVDSYAGNTGISVNSSGASSYGIYINGYSGSNPLYVVSSTANVNAITGVDFGGGSGGRGVYGGSSYGSGVYGSGGQPGSVGVTGVGSTGVTGVGDTAGVTGTGTVSGATGVNGVNNNVNGFAIVGSCAAAGSRGVYGYSVGDGGVGVMAAATGASGIGVYVTAASGYNFYAGGSGPVVGPFTGAHDGLVAKSETLEVGDLVIDLNCAGKNGLSNTIFYNGITTMPRQKGVLGMVVSRTALPDRIPPEPEFGELGDPASSDWLDSRENTGPTALKQISETAYMALRGTHDLLVVNALGEGQVNVCKEGGDILTGDYLCSSSTWGKAMNQGNDDHKSYTVARARESAVWAPGDNSIKQIACIYLSG